MTSAIAEPDEQRRREARGSGSCVSSATLTESSKPISAKNASDAPDEDRERHRLARL